ncbi:MAG: DUF2914 domain-containing protein [Candidatus Latescibacteria bacterium]|nr:DUF2914 domain-containing protein [Candidatus Latescibacterota bacterium]
MLICRPVISYTLVMFFFLSGIAVSQERTNLKKTGIIVEKFSFCERIEKRQPAEVKKEFPANIGRVYLWTTLTGVEQPTKIKHIWYYNNEKVLEISLNVRYKRTRTWSYKNIQPDMTGDWYVEVVDDNNKVIGKFSFKITD